MAKAKKGKSETDQLKDKIAERFIQLRNDQNKTQQELAEQMGITQNTIWRMENGLKISTSQLLSAFLFYTINYKLNPEWLFSFDNSPFVPYYTDVKKAKRKIEGAEKARLELFDKLIAEIQKTPSLFKSPDEDEEPGS